MSIPVDLLQIEASGQQSSFVFDWQNVGPGVAMLLAQASSWQTPDYVVRPPER